ncbi:hypothetical protein [Enterococcus gilvus]|uniref:hypothetical protein n=1 Tax=Enterococcus gilvus TaxID=160453 RepID=UPI0028D3B76C|nr:hypothetical protein [Enterococcus gilvus]
MNKELFVVFREDKNDSRLELGVFTDREKAILCFATKVQECQEEWERLSGVFKVVKIGSPQKKNVCWWKNGSSQTWYFQKVWLNEIQKVC